MAVLNTIYPNSLPVFRTHRNLLDDVDANDINVIQREVQAITNILGINPHIYNDLAVPQVDTSAAPTGEGDIDPDTTYTSTARYYDPSVTPVNHGTVSQRLDDIERGKQSTVVALNGGGGVSLPNGSVALSARPRGFRFPKPSASRDPNSAYNGVGLTLRKSGFWVFIANMVIVMTGTATQNDGIYQAAIDVNENWLSGMHRVDVDQTKSAAILNPQRAGFYERGARVTLRAAQSSGRAQTIRQASLAGWLVRET